MSEIKEMVVTNLRKTVAKHLDEPAIIARLILINLSYLSNRARLGEASRTIWKIAKNSINKQNQS